MRASRKRNRKRPAALFRAESVAGIDQWHSHGCKRGGRRGATIALEGANPGDRQTTVASDSGAFELDNLRPGVQYQVTVTAKDLESWKSPPIVLNPGQFFFLTDIRLKLPDAETSVTVYASQEQIATEQVIVEEKQRIFGFIPNFYVTYDPHPVPLTTKLKYRLAFKVATDPVTFFGSCFHGGHLPGGRRSGLPTRLGRLRSALRSGLSRTQ